MGKERHLKKASAFGTLLILLLALVSASSTLGSCQTDRGSTLYVGGSGPGNYTTIQSALDAASPGDTVYVYAGTYDEHLEIHTTLSLIGQARETTVIDGDNNGTVVNITADQVNISGFTIQQGTGAHGTPSAIDVTASGSTITDNVIVNNTFGISLGTPLKSKPQDVLAFNQERPEQSSVTAHSTIAQNIFSGNAFGTFLSAGTTNASITENAFVHNGMGAMLYTGSTHTVIVNNTFEGDGILVLNDSYANTITGNTVNGEPVLYLEGQSNVQITEDQGQVILVRCHNVTVTNQDITDVCVGVQLIDTTQGRLSENILSLNSFVGLFLVHSDDMAIEDNVMASNSINGLQLWGDNCTIVSNKVTNSAQDGVYLYHSKNALIRDNNLSANGNGIDLDTSEGTTLVEGNDIQHGYHGIWLYQNKDTTILNNRLISCHSEGLDMWGCDYTYITDNTITNQSWGMVFHQSTNNLVSGNTLTDSTLTAMLIEDSSDHNTIAGNTILESSRGIDVSSSAFNSISGNTVTSDGDGISLFNAFGTTVADNLLTSNPQQQSTGVWLAYADNSTVAHNTIVNATTGIGEMLSRTTLSDNTITRSTKVGILCLAGSNHTSLIGNTITESGTGVSVDHSDSLAIAFNTVRNGTSTGIDIQSSDNQVIANNVILSDQDGIRGASTSHDILSENMIENNRGTGIYLKDANHNKLSSNVISANDVGINISGDSNTIIQNLVADNSLGITLYRFVENTVISSNNLVNNTKDAGFVGYISYRHNKWTYNFWGRARWLPYPIVGTMDFDGPFSKAWPWVVFDWHPAKHPTTLRTA